MKEPILIYKRKYREDSARWCWCAKINGIEAVLGFLDCMTETAARRTLLRYYGRRAKQSVV